MEVLAELLRRLDPAGVGRDDDQVVAVQPDLVLEVVREDRQGRQVVEWEVEVPLDLSRVEVDRDHAVGAGGGEEVRDQLGADRLPESALWSWRVP